MSSRHRSRDSNRSRGKRADASTPWSDWTWSNDLRQEWRGRYGPSGEVEYECRDAQEDPLDQVPEEEDPQPDWAAEEDASIPRRPEPYTDIPSATWNSPGDGEPEEDFETSFAGMNFSSSSSRQPRYSTEPTPSSGLSADFQVISRPRRFFMLGRVFKTVWTEPAGDTSVDESANIASSPFGIKTFTKMRTFVVVKEMRGCCICLPLFTYNGQGTTKKGVRPEDYAAVYEKDQEPPYFPAENLTKDPYPIKVENPSERIDPMSRLNFGKVYTVEHNVKVLKVGRIPDEYHERLKEEYVSAIAGPEWARYR